MSLESWFKRFKELESRIRIEPLEPDPPLDLSHLTDEERRIIADAEAIIQRHGNTNFKEYSEDEMHAFRMYLELFHNFIYFQEIGGLFPCILSWRAVPKLHGLIRGSVWN